MTWKILKEDKTSIKKIEKDFKHAIKIIENTIVFYLLIIQSICQVGFVTL